MCVVCAAAPFSLFTFSRAILPFPTRISSSSNHHCPSFLFSSQPFLCDFILLQNQQVLGACHPRIRQSNKSVQSSGEAEQFESSALFCVRILASSACFSFRVLSSPLLGARHRHLCECWGLPAESTYNSNETSKVKGESRG